MRQMGDAFGFRKPAEMRNVGLQHVDSVFLQRLENLSRLEPALAGRDLDRRVGAHLGQRIDTFRRRRLLDPSEVETRELPAHGDRGRHVQPAVHVEHQVDLRADGIPHCGDDIDGFPALPATHFKIGDVERVPFQGAITHLHRLAGALGIVLRLGRAEKPVIGVTRYAIPVLSAQELEHRHAERLSLDIQKRGIDRAQRRAEHRAGAPVTVAVQLFDDRIALKRIAADERAFQFPERGNDGFGFPFQRRLAHAVYAVIGVELDEDEIGARHIGDEDVQPDYFHVLMPCLNACCGSRRRAGRQGSRPSGFATSFSLRWRGFG